MDVFMLMEVMVGQKVKSEFLKNPQKIVSSENLDFEAMSTIKFLMITFFCIRLLSLTFSLYFAYKNNEL